MEDSGHLKGITRQQLDSSLEILQRLAERIPAKLEQVTRIPLSDPDRWVAEVLIRAEVERDCNNRPAREVRVALFGASGAGKTSLVAMLTNNQADNGRGSARLSLLHHRHELLSGRTSTVTVASVAMGETGELIISNEFGDPPSLTDQQRWLGAPLHLHFFDLAGADRYCRTALCSLASAAGPDLVLLVGAEKIEDWRVGLLKALHIPFWGIHSKADLKAEHISGEQGNLPETEGNDLGVSSVSGEGIPELRQRLHHFGMNLTRIEQGGDTRFLIEKISQLEEGEIILFGVILSGRLIQGERYQLNGRTIMVRSIQRHRISVGQAVSPQMVSLAIAPETGLHKGQLILSLESPPMAMVSELHLSLQPCLPKKEPRFPLQGTVFINGGKVRACLSTLECLKLDEPVPLINQVTKVIFLGDNGFLYAGLLHR